MSTSNQRRSILIAGATGLVGSRILQALLADRTVAAVQALSRRPWALHHPKLQIHSADFSRLPALAPVDEVYLALGTTIKVAGSRAAFRAVDLDANLSAAKAAVCAGATRAGLVSAAGASPQSSMFYNRVKGELEEALIALHLDALVIAQPSLLLDDRSSLQQPVRIGEKIAIPIAKLLAPILPRQYQPVHARAVAQSLIKTVPSARGTVVLASDEIARIGREH
ncbi:MAG: nucleoside-diphosphate sugar epimerase [Xanthomonadaceae bacterium]|nr:nucleoside-diphosphate sugar epimerase [Xanthomonadaceae bacterium]